MKKSLLLCFFCLLAVTRLWAAEQPKISVGDDVTWYLIQLSNGKSVLTAQGDNEEVLTGVPMGRDAQLWKIEGTSLSGYTLTSRTGLTLYTTTTAKNGMFKAAKAPASNSKFVWQTTTNTTYSGDFVLSPKANTGVYMNQWGGAGSGKKLGLWDDRSDVNQPFTFVSVEDFEKTGKPLSLVPYPASLTRGDGALSLSKLQGIVATGDAPLRYATEFAEQAKRTLGVSLTVNPTAAGCYITMEADANLAHEAYRLSINENGVKICSADSTGFFYGLQTLKQLLPAAIYGQKLEKSEAWTLPYVEIEDQPNLGHRGFMVDVARHFFSKKEIMRVLDVMASYKMNRFHWHLTDDQGWRIQIPEYPLLTEVGSVRNGSFSNAGGASKFFDDTEYGRGMWYSLDDLREIVAYAKARNIEIIPEVDLPGHMVAAVAAYPELSCDPSKKYSVRIDGGISKDVLNIGKDEVVDFLKCVLGHVAEVFPYQYIHLGGDECPTNQWANNADCLRRVKEQGLSGVNELQSWLVEELGMFLKEKYGKDIVVWDELLSHWKSTNQVKPVIMAWNSIAKSSEAANKGFKSIVVPYQSLYFDMMQVPTAQRDVNEKYQGGWGDNFVNSVETVYNMNPLGSLSGREEFCLGVQGNMWTETCNDSTELEYQLFPRMLALAETGWLPATKKNWVDFYQRLQGQSSVLDALGVTYATHYFEKPSLSAAEEAVKEAEEILTAAADNYVGLPAADKKKALTEALDGVKANMEDADRLTALTSAISDYKKADISMPEAGKYYLILSASTYYKAKYVGSSLYASDNNVRFHYTKQYQPEEVWQFVPATGGYKVKNVLTGKELTMPSADAQNMTLTQNGSVMTLALATKASGEYTYIPAVLNLSADGKYLSADCTGYAKSGTDAALCYQGTWRVVEVTDFAFMLQRLVDNCETILREGTPGAVGEPTEEAFRLLNDELVAPAKVLLDKNTVARADYDKFLAVYQQFMAMPRVSVLDGLDEAYFYNLRNAYFPDYYAQVSSSNIVQPRKMTTNNPAFQWRIRKNADGTVSLFCRKNNKPAYPGSDADGAKILVGKEYSWTLDHFTCDEGQTGVRIKSASGDFTWYVNTNTWANNVVLKPIAWGAGIWTFEKLDIETGIDQVTTDNGAASNVYYDLQGRLLQQPSQHGVYIRENGEKVIR